MPIPASTPLASTPAASSEDAALTEPVCFLPDDWKSLVNDYAGEGRLIRAIWLRCRPARVYVKAEKRWVEILDLQAANHAMTEYSPSVELNNYTRDRLTAADPERHGRRFFDWETFCAIAAMYAKRDVTSFEDWKRRDEKRRKQDLACLTRTARRVPTRRVLQMR